MENIKIIAADKAGEEECCQKITDGLYVILMLPLISNMTNCTLNSSTSYSRFKYDAVGLTLSYDDRDVHITSVFGQIRQGITGKSVDKEYLSLCETAWIIIILML